MELWSHPWWVLGLMNLTVLFMLLFGLFMASYRVFKRRLGWGPRVNLSPTNVEIPFQGTTTLSHAYPQPLPGLGSGGPQWLSTWVTRIFIAIALQCAAIFLLSQFPGFQSPFWLGIVLQGYTYGSAFLFYASGWEDRSGY